MRDIPRTIIAGVALALASGTAFAEGSLTLARDGKPASIIVLSAEPTRSAQLAACELQHHVSLITGAELPIVKENEELLEGSPHLYVGESAATRKMGLTSDSFKRQEHLVKITDQHAVMMGHDHADRGEITYEKNGAWPKMSIKAADFDVGTLYAVYDFLERECGVRWYMVTDLGTVHPKTETLEVKPVSRRTTPWTTYRIIGSGSWAVPGTYGRPGVVFGYVRNKNFCKGRDGLLYTLRTRQNGASFHFGTHTLRMYNKRYAKTHPDWFVDSSPGPKVQLRLWKDEIVELVTKDVIEYFNKPESERLKGDREFPMGKGDICKLAPLDNRIFGNDCKPPLQLNRKRPGTFSDGIASNYWFNFVNRVAKKVRQVHPDKWISSPAYASHYEPPEFDLEPNIGVHIANTQGWDEDSYGMENLRAWRKKVKRVFTYEYWYSHGKFPAIRPHKVADYIGRLKKIGLEGWNMELISGTNSSVYHLDYYVNMRLLFDKGADVDQVLEEYYGLFYGPAREPMRQFWTAMESDEVKEMTHKLGISDRHQFWYVVGLTDLMNRLDGLLQEAEQVAEEEPYASRVRIARTGIHDMMKFRIASGTKVVTTAIPEIEVKKTALKPIIDGKLDDAVWEGAATTSPFVHTHARKAATEDVGKIAWDGERLYIGYILMEPYMEHQVLTHKSSSSGICLDDSVELFIDVGHRKPKSKRGYLQAMLTAGSVIWRYQWAREGDYPFAQDMPDLGITGRAWRGEDRWTVEFAVPIKSLPFADGGLPKPGDEWGLNLTRNRRHGKFEFKHEPYERYARPSTKWSPTFSTNHNTQRFGVLRFVE